MTDPTRASQERDTDTQGSRGGSCPAPTTPDDPEQSRTRAPASPRSGFRNAAGTLGPASAVGLRHGVNRGPGIATTPPPAAGEGRSDDELVQPSDDEPTGGELVRDYLAGDTSAFTELVRRHRWSVFLTCLRVLENHQDAEDQAQCVFEKALYAMSHYRGECEIGAWLRTIAENMSYNARRSRRSRRANESRASAAGDGGDLPDPGAQDLEHAAVTRLAFEQALAAIPEPHQHTFRLVYLAGLSKAEAAEVEQINVGTVGSRCSRAKKALADYLREIENL